jgi:hypothetical protein
MSQDTHLDGTRARAKLWAALTLSLTVTTASAMTIANAQGKAHSDKVGNKFCTSSLPCLDETNSGSGPGVQGNSTNGVGAYGYSSNYYGVYGDAQGQYAGVGAKNTYTGNNYASGVYGESTNGYGVLGYTHSPYGFGLVSVGNVYVQGVVYTYGFCSSGCSRTRHQASFAASTSQPTIDDMGEASLQNGTAHIALASDFTNAIDTHKPYLVLLTPEGNASLYVSSRTASGFDVREVGGGRSTVSFAYRIVGKPYGVRDERLPFKTLPDPAVYGQRQAGR